MEEAPQNKIFVGGLSLGTTDSGFTSFFSKFGQITDSTVMRDRVTGTSRGFGFVIFADKSSVDRVMATKSNLNLDGRRIDCKLAVPRSESEEATTKIFVGGLALETKDSTFTSFFSKYGEITDSTVMRDRMTNASRGFGFITFAERHSVDQVMADRANLTLDSRRIDVKIAVPKSQAGRDGVRQLVGSTAKIFVGGILLTTTNEELQAYFEQYGPVREAQIMMDAETCRSRGFGFVTFETDATVDTILQGTHTINGKTVECKKAVPKTRQVPGGFPGQPGPGFGDFGGPYGPPPQYGGGYGYGGYGAPPAAGGYGGYGPPPAAGAYGAPPAAGGYGAPPAAGAYGAPPAAGGYGAPPAAGAYGAQAGAYGAPPAAGAYGAPQQQAGAYGAPPAAGAYGAPQQQQQAAYGAPPAAGAYGAKTGATAGYGPTQATRQAPSYHPYQR